MSIQQSAMRTMPAPKWGKEGDKQNKKVDEEAGDKSSPTVPPEEVIPSPRTNPLDVLKASGLVDASQPSPREDYTDDGSAGDADLLAAQAEWDAVETVIPDLPGEKRVETGQSENVHRSLLVYFDEALEYFKKANLEEYKSKIRTSVERHGFSAFTHFCFGPPKLHRDLHEERDMLFCIAACNFDNQQPVHLRVLQTVYKTITGSKFDCQRFGEHWDQIGFQGNDPATDLRGSGFLGLLNLLYFVTNAKTSSLAKDVYKLSLHQSQNFPFAVMSINITKIALQTLREDHLNKECNRRGAIFSVFNDFFVGTYLHLYLIWKQQHKTISDSGFVIKDVETFCKKNSQKVIKNLEAYLSEKPKSSMDSMPSKSKTEDDKDLTFSGVETLS